MSDFSPQTPIQLQIRKIIFEKFNDVDLRFNNDEIFDIIKKNGDINNNWIVDDLEPFFNEICEKNIARNIAQNFTTMWFKLFEPLQEIKCNACGLNIHVGKTEEKSCPNPSCHSPI